MAAAAYHVEEERLWKCPNHPSKRQRHGVCPACLHDRLIGLCPTCGKVRPCPCVSAAISPSSSTSSSSFGDEHALRRSKSLAIPFLRSNSFISIFRRSKGKKSEEKIDGCNLDGDDRSDSFESNEKIEDFARMITRSRSVSVGTSAMASGSRLDDARSSPGKAKFWHFPSRIKAFRKSKTPKPIVQDRSSLLKG